MILQLMVLVKLNLFLLDHFWFQSPVYGGNQLVLYDPVANDDGEIGPIPTQPLHLQSPDYILCSTIRQETSLNEYLTNDATLSQFSFQIRRPWQEDYVRKCPAHMVSQGDDPKLLEHVEASPRALSWTGADDFIEPQPSIPTLPVPPCPGSDLFLVKKKKKRPERIESKMYSNPAYEQLQVEELGQSGSRSDLCGTTDPFWQQFYIFH